MSLYTGTVDNVVAEPRQANVTADAAVGSSTLLLDSVAPFREAGGEAFVDGVLMPYLTIDGELESMTLAAPLAVAVAADSTVQVAQQGIGALDWTVNVLIDGQEGLDDEPVPAIIPHELIGYLREGFDDAGKVVTLSATARGLYLDEIDGGNPLFDGSTLDPGIPIPPEVVPPAPPAPPVAPADSPVPVPSGYPGGILVRLPPPLSANTPTVVDVYMSDASPVPLDSTHLHGTAAAGSLYQVEALPAGMGGADLSYVMADGVTPVVYYFVAVAKSAEDPSLAADPSSEVQGSMRQVTGPDVSVAAVWAGTVEAGHLTSGTTEAEIVLAGVLESRNPSGPEFGRVGLSQADGFYSRGEVPVGGELSDAPILVHFPTNGSPNIVSGIFEAVTVTVTGGATFRGVTSLEPEAVLMLEQGTQPPKSPPAVVINYSTVVQSWLGASELLRGLTLGHDANWYACAYDESAGAGRICRFSAAGALLADWSLPAGTRPTGIVYVAAVSRYAVMTHKETGFGLVDRNVRVYGTAMDFLLTTNIGSWIGPDSTIGWDHTNSRLLHGYMLLADDFVHAEGYTVAAGGSVTFVGGSLWSSGETYGGAADLGYIARGSFDYGADRYVFRKIASASNEEYRVYTTVTSPVRQTAQEWPANGQVRGGWWDGTRFYSVNGAQGERVQYEGGRAKPDAAVSWRWSFDYRWFDSKTTKGITVATTSASPIITAADYTFGVNDIGVAIAGAGIPAGSTILSVTAGSSTATLTNNATATASGVAATLTSAQQETGASPRASFTMTKRARVTLTLATIPTGRAGVNDPDSIRVYWGRGATDAATTMAREKTLVPGVKSMAFDPSATAEGGAVGPAFANTTPAQVAAAGGGFWVDGASNGSLGTAGLRQAVDDRVAAVGPVQSLSAVLNASGSFAGTVQFVRTNRQVTVVADIQRATGFNASFADIGVTVPTQFRPAANVAMPPAIVFNGTASYSFRIDAAGIVSLRQSAAFTASMTLAASYIVP